MLGMLVWWAARTFQPQLQVLNCSFSLPLRGLGLYIGVLEPMRALSIGMFVVINIPLPSALELQVEFDSDPTQLSNKVEDDTYHCMESDTQPVLNIHLFLQGIY